MDTQMTCQLCNRDTCRCAHRINQQLQELISNYDLAAKALQPGQGSTRRSNETPLGIRLAALDYITGHDVLPTLEDWERDWRHHYGLTAFGDATHQRAIKAAVSHANGTNHAEAWSPTRNRLIASVTFLEAWLHRALTDHPAITDFANEIRNLHHTSRRAAANHPPTQWTITCPATTDTGNCNNTLRITGDDYYTTITCHQCRTAWPIERLLRVAAADKQSEIWLAPDDAARFFGLDTSTLRRWARNKRIKRRHGQYEHHSIRAAITGANQ